MPRPGPKMIEDFLLPALNSRKYGDHLKWINKDEKIFSIKWSHKSGGTWTQEDTVVFQDWDKKKGNWNLNKKDYLMNSKQRFRSALYKLNVKKLKSTDKYFRIYQLKNGSQKRPQTEQEVPASSPGINTVEFWSTHLYSPEESLSPSSSTSEREAPSSPEFSTIDEDDLPYLSSPLALECYNIISIEQVQELNDTSYSPSRDSIEDTENIMFQHENDEIVDLNTCLENKLPPDPFGDIQENLWTHFEGEDIENLIAFAEKMDTSQYLS